jgi:hypothetical protein
MVLAASPADLQFLPVKVFLSQWNLVATNSR